MWQKCMGSLQQNRTGTRLLNGSIIRKAKLSLSKQEIINLFSSFKFLDISTMYDTHMAKSIRANYTNDNLHKSLSSF